MVTSRLSRRISLADLEILYAVTEHGSMAAAAAHLGISQPAISRAISELETALNVRLLDRDRRGAAATPSGALLARRAAAVLDEIRHGLKEIEFLSGTMAGEVHIGAPEPLAEALLPAVTERYCRRNQDMSVNIVPTLAGEFSQLRGRHLDFQINRLLPGFSEGDIEAIPLFEEKIFVVAGLSSPWARRRTLKLTDLVNEKWVVQNNASDNVSFVFKSRKLPSPRATVAAYSAFFRNVLTARGDFLAVLVSPQLHVLRAQGLEVKVLPVDLSDLSIEIAAFRLRNRTLNPISQMFLNDIRNVCAKGNFFATR